MDLENLAFLATGLQPLQMLCRHKGVELRAYATPKEEWEGRATHLSRSSVREAADVRMIVDAARITERVQREIQQIRAAKANPPGTPEPPSCRILLVTDDDRFGAALAAEVHEVDRVEYDEALPALWRGSLDASAFRISEFAQHGILMSTTVRTAPLSATSAGRDCSLGGSLNRSSNSSRATTLCASGEPARPRRAAESGAAAAAAAVAAAIR